MNNDNNHKKSKQHSNLLLELIRTEGVRRAFFEGCLPAIRRQALSQLDAADHKHEPLQELLRWLDLALKKYEDGSPPDHFYFDIFRIGAIYGQYMRSIEAEYAPYDIRKVFVEKNNREKSLHMKQFSRNTAKRLCQQYASELWAKPENETVRLGDMCERVWAMAFDVQRETRNECEDPELIQIMDNAIKEMPDLPLSLKKWLREVAPPTASRPGAPKKQHKPTK